MAGKGLSNALAMLDHRACPIGIQNSFERSSGRLVFFMRLYLCSYWFIIYGRVTHTHEGTVTVT